MSFAVREVSDYFIRRGWNETWDYPSCDPLLQLPKSYPNLSPFYFSFEVSYSPLGFMVFSRHHYWIAPFSVLLYLLFVFIGPKLMLNRKPLQLKTPLKYWNLIAAIFSIWGTIRIIPHAFLLISKSGFTGSLCVPPVWSFGSGAAGFWTVLFVVSKFLELGDTVFIILRKRPLTFLHWYHHATVLLYTWDGYVTEQPPGLYFAAMNYAVHALMYTYYYLAAAQARPPRWGVHVTFWQIVQMFVGVGITAYSLMLSFKYPFPTRSDVQHGLRPLDTPGQPPTCYLTRSNLYGGAVMYFTYMCLFLSFFWDRYLRPKKLVEKQV